MDRNRFLLARDLEAHPPANRLDVRVDIHINFASVAHWPPATLEAFMRGVAQVVSATAELDR
jgi:hypothetical protein